MENTTDLLNLSENEMLALCKRVMKLEPALDGAIALREDGIDIDAWILTQARSWYSRLLLEAPASLLPVEDVAADVTLTVTADGIVIAAVPPRCVRPVEWRLTDWLCSVTHFNDPDDPTARRQLSPWTRAAIHRPVIVDHGDHLLLYSLPPDTTPELATARCVVTPDDNRYIFHHSLLSSLIPSLQ